MAQIPFLRPQLVEKRDYEQYLDQIDATNLYSNFGPLNQRFEARVIDEVYEDVGACVTVSNATLGLVLAISEVKRPGKYAVMPSFTFAAAAQAALWCGLEPYFVDVEAKSWTMSEKALQTAIQTLGDQVAVVVPYATFGTYLALDCYTHLLSRRNPIPVVVDAAASFGASKEGVQFGKGFDGVVVYSFHATKAFGIGEGGLVYSGSNEVVDAIRRRSNFGFGGARASMSLGLNAKLSEYGAAIALATLDAYPKRVPRRVEIYSEYISLLESAGAFQAGWAAQELSGTVPHQFFPLRAPRGRCNSDVLAALAENSIQARTYFSPACHQQELFSKSPRAELPETEALSREILSLPLYEDIRPQELREIVGSLL